LNWLSDQLSALMGKRTQSFLESLYIRLSAKKQLLARKDTIIIIKTTINMNQQFSSATNANGRPGASACYATNNQQR
jgi:hypothetical protein